MATVVLGSSSIWRRTIAAKALGVDVDLISPDIDERAVVSSGDPRDHCDAIAHAKLDAVLGVVENPDAVVLCFDTIVVHQNHILEKPERESGVLEMISRWNKGGERLVVLTAVAMGQRSSGKKIYSVEEANVIIQRPMTEDELSKYITESQCQQSSGALVVENLIEYKCALIEGDQTVIEGLPVSFVKSKMSFFQ